MLRKNPQKLPSLKLKTTNYFFSLRDAKSINNIATKRQVLVKIKRPSDSIPPGARGTGFMVKREIKAIIKLKHAPIIAKFINPFILPPFL
jgi:hypothetical protein